MIELHLGDCLDVMKKMDSESIDCILTDPPYGLGVEWWDALPSDDVWKEVFRLVRPGAFLAAFGSCKTYHRLASSIERAGFTVVDTLMWLNAQARPFETQLRRGHDPIVLARAPLSTPTAALQQKTNGLGLLRLDDPDVRIPVEGVAGATRHPSNVIHDGSPEVMEFFDAIGPRRSGKPTRKIQKDKSVRNRFGPTGGEYVHTGHGDDGSVARFFFHAKVKGNERAKYPHPTQKPVEVLRWLVKLTTAPGHTILDPFAGSGSTGVAAHTDGRGIIMIEQEPSYFAIAEQRMRDTAVGVDVKTFV